MDKLQNILDKIENSDLEAPSKEHFKDLIKTLSPDYLEVINSALTSSEDVKTFYQKYEEGQHLLENKNKKGIINYIEKLTQQVK